MDWLTQLVSTPFDFLMDYGLPFVLVLSLLVFVHEWGHYIVARMCGVRIVTFSIGFGRELFGRNDKNGTRWKVSLIPLGGYVQMFGDRDITSSTHSEIAEGAEESRPMTEEEKKVAFFAQKLWKRTLIVFAGPAINFIFAIILLTGLYTFHGQPYTPPIAATIMEGKPAEVAGLLPDDKILSVNGVSVKRFQDLVQLVSLNLNQELDMVLVRSIEKGTWSDEEVTIKVTPELVELTDRFGFKSTVGRIGVISPPGDIAIIKHNVFSAFSGSVVEVWNLTTGTLKAIGQMITGTRSADELGGVLRIGAYAGAFAQAGFISMITFAALLSVNLGLINLFPVPLLDGGHLAFYAIEAVSGGPLSERSQEYALRVGLLLIGSLMVFATWNDLVQLKILDYVKDLVS